MSAPLHDRVYDALYRVDMTCLTATRHNHFCMAEVHAWSTEDQEKVLEWATIRSWGSAEEKAASTRPTCLDKIIIDLPIIPPIVVPPIIPGLPGIVL